MFLVIKMKKQILFTLNNIIFSCVYKIKFIIFAKHQESR